AAGHIERSIDDDALLNTSEWMLRVEDDIPAGAISLPAERRAAQADPHTIEDFAIIINCGGAKARITDAVNRIVEVARIRGSHDQRQFISDPLGCWTTVAHAKEGARVRAGCRKEGLGAAAVRTPDIKLHY